MDANSPTLSRPAGSIGQAARNRAEGVEIDAEQFCSMLVSRRRLVRLERHGEARQGLRDLDSGELFYIDERELFETR